MQRGFEKFYGTIIGAGSFYDPATLCRGNQFITPENDEDYKPKTYYYTDAISDNAVTFLQEHAKETPDKPVFLYVSHTTAHWPMHALPEDIARYKGVYDGGGFQEVRAKRFARLKEMGLIHKDLKLSPQSDDWEKAPWANGTSATWKYTRQWSTIWIVASVASWRSSSGRARWTTR